ncbi:MAG TPA: hypothetical protein VFT69_17015 [Pseudolabrys sp.]|nr:hypothetical protein [Pseudolabrys sp.]
MHDTALPFNRGNRHPVDRLADVRAEIKRLQEQESDLKALISTEMGSRDSLGGDEFIAFQSLQERRGAIDEASLKAAGINPDKHRKPKITSVVLRVERRAAEVA